MKACSLSNLMEEITPWLDQAYIHDVEVDANHRVVLHFVDGMKNVYQVDDCTREQLAAILEDLKARGIPVKD